MQAHDCYGRTLNSHIIGEAFKAAPKAQDQPGLALYAPQFRNMANFEETLIRNFKPSNGGNFRQLAKRYGMTLVQIHGFIYSRRPDLYDRAANGEKAYSAFDVSKLSISSASSSFRTLHRTDDAASNLPHWGKWKKSSNSRHFYVARLPANKAAVLHTDYSIHISGDTSGLSLVVSSATGPALELTFASDDRNAGIHKSCRL